MFEHLNAFLPVNRVLETQHLLAFRHPKPAYPIHILIVPKKSISDLTGLAAQPVEYRSALMDELLYCVRELVLVLKLEKPGYRLIVNGGGYQDVGELHFHLVSGEMPPR
jgi:histidine triad (HIT) family protein